MSTLVRLLQGENGTCLSALYTAIKPRYSTGKPFVLAECPYLYWWTDAKQGRSAQTTELQLFEDAYPNFEGAVKEYFHCKHSFPKGDTLPGQNVGGGNAKLCIFWPTDMWKQRNKRKNMQCHQCRHKDVMHHCKVMSTFRRSVPLSSPSRYLCLHVIRVFSMANHPPMDCLVPPRLLPRRCFSLNVRSMYSRRHM